MVAPQWVISALWERNQDRAHLRIPDTVVYENGSPHRWLFTNKNGEIVKKRSLDFTAIKNRFTRIALQNRGNDQRLVCVARYIDGRATVLNADEFQKLAEAKLEGLSAIQCYIHARGGPGTVYRNDYSVVKGRVLTATSKHAPGGTGGASGLRCFATRINEQLDRISKSVVRYIECHKRVRVLKMTAEYVIDDDEKIWFSWPASAVISSCDGKTSSAMQDLTSPSSRQKRSDPATKFLCAGSCSGDFCNFFESGTVSSHEIAQRLFSGEEFSLVSTEMARASPESERPTLENASTEMFDVTFKSIALARSEERAPFRQDLPERNDAALGVMRSTLSNELKMSWAERRGEVRGGASNYYRNVKVCSACFKVYTTLDQGRDVLRRCREGNRVAQQSFTAVAGRRSARTEAFPNRGNGQEMLPPVCPEKSHALPPPTLPTRKTTRNAQASAGLQSFGDLDAYLRGSQGHRKKINIGVEIGPPENLNDRLPAQPATEVAGRHNEGFSGNFCGRILVADDDEDSRQYVLRILGRELYDMEVSGDGADILELTRARQYDLLLLACDLPTVSGIEVTKLIRQREKQSSHGVRHLPIVAFSEAASPEDLRLYMEVGMDGCVSKPVDEASLINTVAAAIPHHRPPGDLHRRRRQRVTPGNGPVSATIAGGAPSPQNAKGIASSSSVASLTLPVSSSKRNREQESGGIFQMDSDTAISYIVLGKQKQGTPLFNFVAVHDFFDTYENLQIFFHSIVSKYPGVQVLLWNVPGQAFTEWRRDVILNNVYFASCLEALLRHVDYTGTGEFITRGPYGAPFFLMGFGNGANVAVFYSLRYDHPNMRALLMINGFSHVDQHLAGVLHDCMNVFSCSPATRPDLPVYFWTRFLFSAAYLTRVSTPLALNLYTAVHNPITLEGRMQICKGALCHQDIRAELHKLHYPLIIVHSSQNSLVKPSHVGPFIHASGGECRTIRRCLRERQRPNVIWLHAGHEVFQESRKSIANLLEQLATGYHEKHEVTYMPTIPIERDSGAGQQQQPQITKEFFEDRFIDGILGTLHEVRSASHTKENAFGKIGQGPRDLQAKRHDEHHAADDKWETFKGRLVSNQDVGASRTTRAKAASLEPSDIAGRIFTENDGVEYRSIRGDRLATLDPAKPAFERRENVVYRAGAGSKIYPTDVPEVKEYMQWRLNRNYKRLHKLESAGSCIQRGWRAYLARTLVQRMREQKAALFVQRCWRGTQGRRVMSRKKREEWAVRYLQRCWRGRMGRNIFLNRRGEERAARNIQRLYRGRIGKRRVVNIKQRRDKSARLIQTMFRGRKAREMAWRRRDERNAAIDIQRSFRGSLGRRRAKLEREKYLFSKAQSQGIEFGRQMLLEHKLHATRLQSEVSLLTREKVEAEERVEALLSEIAEFDEGVRSLEREMHQLSQIETEAKGVLDEEARVEMREQKMRLDREFGVMLGKIADRKERLKSLEVKLQTVDRTRQAKEEELRDLERKLVVLLEEQQKELELIKQRQQKRGERFMDHGPSDTPKRNQGGDGSRASSSFGGPTPQQQQQAGALVQSTETLMKFGFMSMSLTYFSSLNMIRAMRKVGALNTVLEGSAGAPTPTPSTNFNPALKPGQMPGQSDAKVSQWSVKDVGDWLATLSLAQYRECFADAAVDGAFLYDLNDEDLRNTLGIEHALHRKKILNSIRRLRVIEKEQALSVGGLSGSSSFGTAMPTGIASNVVSGGAFSVENGPGPSYEEENIKPEKHAPELRFADLASWVRHGKTKELREALAHCSDRQFDSNDVDSPFIDGYGTQYIESVTKRRFHMNKTDEHGNSLLTVACQNGHLRVAQLLVKKGSNPNHQNNQGQTPLHYAMTYNFFDLGAWLADSENGAGAGDQIVNTFGLTPYDGLNP